MPSEYETPQLTGKQLVVSDIADVFRKKGLSENGIRGIFANVNDESGFDPTIRHPDQPKWSGEAHYAHGLYQEGGGEWNNYAAWLGANHPDKDWRDHKLQTEFLADNLQKNYPHVWDTMQRGSPEQAANAFLSGYLKPREDFRQQRMSKYNQGVPDIDYYLSNVKGSYKAPTASQEESPYISRSELANAMAEYAPTQARSFGKYLGSAAKSAAEIPYKARDYYRGLPAATERPGVYNTVVGGGNALLDQIPRAITGGKYGIADVEDALGLPSGRTRESIQAFHNAYAPALQTAEDVGNAGMGGAGAYIPHMATTAPTAVSRGTRVLEATADTGATAFDNAAKNAGNPNQLNVFAPINPTDSRFAQAYRLRGNHPTNEGVPNSKVYEQTKGAFFEPSGQLLQNIPDEKARPRGDLSRLAAGAETTLGDVLDHKKLYEQFPELEGTKIRVESGERNRTEWPHVRTDKGDIVLNLPKGAENNPDLWKNPAIVKRLKEQLVKSAQYLIEEKDPLRARSFRDKPGYEEQQLDSLIDRVDALAQNEPGSQPIQTYAGYLRSFKDKLEAVKNSTGSAEEFIDHPFVADTALAARLRNKIMKQAVSGQDAYLSPQERIELITQGLHNSSAGTLGAQYAWRNANRQAQSGFPYPYRGDTFENSLVRFDPKISDQQLRQAIDNWSRYGNAREYKANKPTEKAEGGPIYMSYNHPLSDDYSNRVNVRGYADGGAIKKPFHPGMAEEGNIDLTKRPIVRNSDGSISTVRSMSANIDGHEVLVPTVSDDGRIMSPRESMDTYIKTGRHLGKFATPEQASDYAQRLHEDQAKIYLPQAQTSPTAPVTPTTPQYRKGGRVSKTPLSALHGFAPGGEVTGSPDGNAQIDPSGVVQDPAGSGPTDDAIEAELPEGSHVIPFEALVKLGNGDPELGKQKILEAISQLIDEEVAANKQSASDEGGAQAEEPTTEPAPAGGMKHGGEVSSKKVPVRISNQELILSPSHVQAVGRGNIDNGHHQLNKMRMKLRGRE